MHWKIIITVLLSGGDVSSTATWDNIAQFQTMEECYAAMQKSAYYGLSSRINEILSSLPDTIAGQRVSNMRLSLECGAT